MIRITHERIIEGNKKYIEAAGLSTDSKPTVDIVTGSLLDRKSTRLNSSHAELSRMPSSA